MLSAFLALTLSLLPCRIPLEPTRTAFVTSVRIGSAGPLRFLVDTGATVTVVDRSVAQRIGLRPTRTLAAISSTGTLNVQEAMVEELRAGDKGKFPGCPASRAGRPPRSQFCASAG